MPISDSYIVQYLLQITQSGEDSLVWQEKDPDGYTACMQGVRVGLESVRDRAGSRLCISILCGQDRIHIEEPPNIGLFGERYRSEDERHLAQLMQVLARSVEDQCSARRKKKAAGREEVRQMVYRRLMGFSPSAGCD